MASTQLRTLIDNVLIDTSRDMVEQSNIVNQAFTRRVDELQDALCKMEEHLGKVTKNKNTHSRTIEPILQVIRRYNQKQFIKNYVDSFINSFS